jgi:hypothetical protein
MPSSYVPVRFKAKLAVLMMPDMTDQRCSLNVAEFLDHCNEENPLSFASAPIRENHNCFLSKNWDVSSETHHNEIVSACIAGSLCCSFAATFCFVAVHELQ